MTLFKTKLLLILLVGMQCTGYAQSENNKGDSAIIIPLKIGKNPSTPFNNIIIEPVNLYIQSKPINNNSPQIQLELNVVENNSKYTTFLWCYKASNNSEKANYPKAYKNYSFDLKINKEDVALVVKKLDFKKPMFINLGQIAIIGTLKILFLECIGEWSEDIKGNHTDAFNTYNIALSEEEEHKTVSFTPLNTTVEKELTIQWKNYKILILEASDKTVKLMVFKNDS
ncbi:hypothetical protein ES676_10890 [Bizionia saleffrena]|uniref:Uncharacterized protein n=1 Tax=Bizionia saleffrena TaxID=291189 RepID=A0A8H2LE24_9FLAO|nr:hypothetical protein [Bizionia saleffrena]TYB72672.1 hypothetical protein ES676_10890 [Bizionia saleffrena]